MSPPKDGGAPETYLASAHLQERREPRHTVSIEIEVSGTDGNGKILQERTATRNVSEWGCQFPLSVELKAGGIVVVSVIAADSGKQARQGMFQVMRVEREEDRWLVGAWKVDSGDIWGAHIENAAKQGEGTPNQREASALEDEIPGRGREQ